MRYLGGKFRQRKHIVNWVKENCPDFEHYYEPFCGAMWSGCAIMKNFPDAKFHFNDINPFLICFWKAIQEGWNPPKNFSESEYNYYNKHRPFDDPVTAYAGFCLSFGGKFFGGFARDKNHRREFREEAYRSCMEKIEIIRFHNCVFSCLDFNKVNPKPGSLIYLDPPYSGRCPQSELNGKFDRDKFIKYAERKSNRNTVITTEFLDYESERGWETIHNFGDTVVRHHSSKGKDGTEEKLYLVKGR
jgi:DNA adenine methylase